MTNKMRLNHSTIITLLFHTNFEQTSALCMGLLLALFVSAPLLRVLKPAQASLFDDFSFASLQISCTGPDMPAKRKRVDSLEEAHRVVNPLRDKELLVSASRAQAAIISRRPLAQTRTAIEFCGDVLREQLGLRDFAIGQWERMIISSARKEALGDEDSRRIVKPAPAAPLCLPTLSECAAAVAGDGSPALLSQSDECGIAVKDLQRHISAAIDPSTLQEQGAMLIPSVLSFEEVASVACLLAKSSLGPETRLRASTGNGVGGSYQSIQLPTIPALAALSAALAGALHEKLGIAKCGTKAIALRYGNGGINWAHQDQSACPYQAVLLLSRPGIDFEGGSLYVTDVMGAHQGEASATNEIHWQGAGDVVVFAANANGMSRVWYHGMRAVGPGSQRCQRLAIGLLQT